MTQRTAAILGLLHATGCERGGSLLTAAPSRSRSSRGLTHRWHDKRAHFDYYPAAPPPAVPVTTRRLPGCRHAGLLAVPSSLAGLDCGKKIIDLTIPARLVMSTAIQFTGLGATLCYLIRRCLFIRPHGPRRSEMASGWAVRSAVPIPNPPGRSREATGHPRRTANLSPTTNTRSSAPREALSTATLSN